MDRPSESRRACCSGNCGEATRRQFLKMVGVGAAATTMPVMAGPFSAAEFERLVSVDKKLSPAWLHSLTARGSREVRRGEELERIGMPIGGLCSGQVYLGGDGRLWHWDIFNRHIATGAEHYAKPMQPSSPLEQGFAVQVTVGETSIQRSLDRSGFANVTFCGEYPIGYVTYEDPALPLTVSLEAFSPFIPLNVDDSSLPATILQFTLKNVGQTKLEVELAGWLENAVGLESASAYSGVRRNRIVQQTGMTVLQASAEPDKADDSERPPMVFADFEGGDYGEWKAEGEAVGGKPAQGPMGTDQRLAGFEGKGLVNTYPGSDGPRGKLSSPSFIVQRPVISFLIGGGNHPGETCINLIVDNKVVRTATGKNTDAMTWENWDVRDLAGRRAHLEIVDNHSGGWGHIDIDQIEFRDRPRRGSGKLEDQPDFGTMVLALLDRADRVDASIPTGRMPEAAFPQAETAAAESKLGERLVGLLGKKVSLAPGEEKQCSFVLAWHFPNLSLGPGREGRFYATKFASATAVAEYIAQNFQRLAGQTRLWHDTWYDSTLPHWFLNRSLLNASILASSTCYRFSSGRFYGWEGVGCCPGTCTHVWHYAHAVARLFPELERDLRERTDFGLAFQPETGVIRFRGEQAGLAIDGQAGCILRAYREHQMSADAAFLKCNWPRIKQAMQCLIQHDANGDGILEGAQHNTLDADWHGPVAWLSGLYLTALRACEEMAREVDDRDFAAQCRAIFERGQKNLVARLFNGEYFINRPDPKRPDAINSGTGCEIDQVFGQSWAFQVSLGRVLPQRETRCALASLWKYNFTPDVGPYREANKPGRWYAMAGEAGLLMCSFPRADWNYDKAKGKGPDWAAGYFNECMTGFEYQVAGHMIWEGMVEEGLAIARAIHDRYHPSRRNPYNEVECGDHYARAMASYGVFLAVCGYEYHGPKGHLAFDPRIAGDGFRAAFTTAEGWGVYRQERDGADWRHQLEVKYGRLRLRTLAVPDTEGKPTNVAVTLSGQQISATHATENGRLAITFASAIVLEAGQVLEIRQPSA